MGGNGLAGRLRQTGGIHDAQKAKNLKHSLSTAGGLGFWKQEPATPAWPGHTQAAHREGSSRVLCTPKPSFII
jgi:hypothetical protein